jgi:integrase
MIKKSEKKLVFIKNHIIFVLISYQELLGHKNSKTTEIYTHASNEGLGKVSSPIEKLKLKI